MNDRTSTGLCACFDDLPIGVAVVVRQSHVSDLVQNCGTSTHEIVRCSLMAWSADAKVPRRSTRITSSHRDRCRLFASPRLPSRGERAALELRILQPARRGLDAQGRGLDRPQ